MKDVTTVPEPLDLSARVAIWQTIAARRANYDAMMWQTPALGLTAQAFLLTLALGPDTSGTGRLVAAGLSLVLALMTAQLMQKHRRHEILDSLLLERIDGRLGLGVELGTLPHGDPRSRPILDVDTADEKLRSTTPGPAVFWRMSSFALWMAGLGLFAIAALLVLIITIAGVDLLVGS